MTVDQQAYSDFEDISKEKDRGVLKKIIKPSSKDEKPCHKDTCHVRYVGKYLGGEEDGKEFDRSDKFDFQLGTGNVIKAWDICVATMRIGEVCELIVAPEYGYKDGKVMKFEIELFYTLGEDISEHKDGSIRKSMLEEGEGMVNPAYGVEAKISYKLFSDPDDKVKEVTYLTGDPASQNIPKGIDAAVLKMTCHEVAKVLIKEADGSSKLYKVTLNSYEKLRHLSTFTTFEEQMNYAETLKERANGHLKSTKYFLAIQTYKRLNNDLEYLVTDGVANSEKLNGMKMVVHNNTALAYIKMKDAENATQELKKVFEMDPKNEKAIFRMGQTFLLLNDHEEAGKHFKQCLRLYPNNTDAAKLAQFCDQQVAKAKQVEKTRFRGIYNKLKETGLGLPDEPEPMEDEPHKGCDSCHESSDEENEPIKA